MISRLAGSEPLEPWQTQALQTQQMLDALQESAENRAVVELKVV